MTTLTVKLPDDVAAWLAARARQLGLPKSVLVREALAALQEAGMGSSALDLAGDAVGRGASKHRDLGSNKRHLSGFGR